MSLESLSIDVVDLDVYQKRVVISLERLSTADRQGCLKFYDRLQNFTFVFFFLNQFYPSDKRRFYMSDNRRLWPASVGSATDYICIFF